MTSIHRHLLIPMIFLLPVSLSASPEPLSQADSLVSVWAASRDNQPLYLAGRLQAEADQAELQAHRRSKLPELRLEAGGDYGQRARPGEERDQGLAGRGEILAQVNWSLLESGRDSRERALALAGKGTLSRQAAQDLVFRADVARHYVEAAIKQERLAVLTTAEPGFQALANALERRVSEGVEPAGRRARIEQAEARRAATIQEAEDAAGAGGAKLALLTGRAEVTPMPPKLSAPETKPEIDWIDSPQLAVLDWQVEQQRAEAETLSRTDRWSLDFVGQAGPYFSNAFDGALEQEYFAGLRFSFSPDWAGVNRARANAEYRRARATEAERASLHDDLQRRSAELADLLHLLDDRRIGREEVLAKARASEHAEKVRWREGVGDWSALYSAREDWVAAQLDELEWRLEMALKLIEYAEISNRLEELPAWLGQEGSAP